MDNENLKQQEVMPERTVTVGDVDLDRMRRLTEHGQAESHAAQLYRQAITNLENTLAQTRSTMSKQIMDLRAEIKALNERNELLTKQLEAEQKSHQVEQEPKPELNGYVLDVEDEDAGKRGGRKKK